MSERIERILDALIDREGGHVIDARDRGGETIFGITIATARANGWTGPMQNMSRAFAKDIYRRQYVSATRFDDVAAISDPIGAELIDTGVNMGPGVAARFLQRALNALNANGTAYADLAVDGEVGDGTINALRKFLAQRGAEGERVLLSALNALQGERYIALAEAHAANEAFVYGWLRTRVAT